MKHIYINENKLNFLLESLSKEDKEITFFSFFNAVKDFLKKLLKDPSNVEMPALFKELGISQSKLISLMKKLKMIKCDEDIVEVPIDEDKTHPYNKKLVSKHMVKYSVFRRRFEDKVKELYKELCEEKRVFSNEGEMIDDILDMDDSYKELGGYKDVVDESDCNGVMQGGLYDAPMFGVQRKKFYGQTIKRNDDEENGSISMNRKK